MGDCSLLGVDESSLQDPNQRLTQTLLKREPSYDEADEAVGLRNKAEGTLEDGFGLPSDGCVRVQVFLPRDADQDMAKPRHQDGRQPHT